MKTTLKAKLWLGAFLAVATVMFLFPIFWVMLTSLKAPAQVLQMPPAWLFAPQLENYSIVFTTRPFLQALINSTIVTVCSTVLSLITGAAAAYSLARFRLPGSRWVTFSVFLAKMFPPVVLVVPFFVMFRSIGGTDSLLTLIVTYTSFNLPFVIWLLWGFFKELPAGLEEAAAVDGCTRFGAMIRIMLPLARPGLAVAAIFAAMNSWNEFLIAMSLTSGNAGTLPVLASTFVTQEAILWGPITAAATMLMLPIFAFTLAVQKHLVAGLTQGAVK